MSLRWRWSWAWFIGALVGCTPHRPPVVVPTPPPPVVEEGRPSSPQFTELELRTTPQGTLTRGGVVWDMVGGIPCWPTENTGEVLRVGPEGRAIPYLWPLVSKEWIRYFAAAGGNAVHTRTGPIKDPKCCGLETVGGPYLADGITLNKPFWDLFHVAHREAGKLGVNVQNGVLDGWVLKNAVNGEPIMALPEEDIQHAHDVPIRPNIRRWVFDLVKQGCNWRNAFWEIGNESDLAQGWTREWERAMFQLIREAERQEGCPGTPALIGSNTRDESGPYDLFAVHWPVALTGPTNGGRFTMVNEYNPSLAPAQFKSLYCTARASRQAFFWWRSDGSDARQEQSLDIIRAGCDAPASCPDPRPSREKLSWNIPCKPNGVCDATPLHTKDIGYCTSIGKGIGPDGVTPNATCSIRNECPDTPGYEGMCADRLACEQYALSVPGVCNAMAPLWRSDGEVVLEDAWGFRARCNGCTWLEACNCDGTNCGRAQLR